MERLNAALQDARTLLKAARKYEAKPDADGIDPDLIGGLAGAVERALAADTTQQNSIRDVDRYTEAQDKALDASLLLIRRLQAAAKARFGTKDGPVMREFRVGVKPSQTVKGMLGDLAYLKGVADKYAGDLARFGFKAADLSNLDKAAAGLAQADASQEMAKKAQVNATAARDKALKDLLQAMAQARNNAKSVFAGRRDVLREFESIRRARARKTKVSSAGAGS